MVNESVLAASGIIATAVAVMVFWMLRGSRLEGIRQWTGELSFFIGVNSRISSVQSNIRRLARTVSSLQKDISSLKMQIKAAEAEINAGPSVHSFCTLRERVDRLEKGWVTANSVRRILDANEKNLQELRGDIELLYRKVDGKHGF